MITQERARNLEAQVEAQAKRIAELAEFSRMASKAILLREKLLLKQSAALKLAREALTDWLTTDLDEQQCWQALAAIDALKGE